MLQSALYLLMSGMLFILRTAPADCFPKPLSKEREEECLRLWLEGDIDARNELVEHNLRLVTHIMKKYYTQTDDSDDLISVGTIGLIKGINTYRPDKGVRLATYASRCIENEILMYFRAQKKTSGDVSLSETIDAEGDGERLLYMDVIAQEEDMAETIEERDICQCLRRNIDAVLDKREKKIINLRYGLDGRKPLTQKEAAQICSISRSYVSRIEKKALEKLKKCLEQDC